MISVKFKRFTAMAMASALFLTGVPFFPEQSPAEPVKTLAAELLPLRDMDNKTRDVKIHEPSVKNVFNREWIQDKIKNGFFSSDRYFTYRINGENYDSRFVDEKVNLDAWRNMTESDKLEVMKIYWVPNNRIEVFGQSGSAEMTKWYNDITGWSEAWKMMAQKIESKYSNGLLEIYDDDDNGVDHFKSIKSELNPYVYGSAYEKLYNLRSNPEYAEEAGKILSEGRTISGLLEYGKGCYDHGIKIKKVCWENSAKAVGQYTIKYIIDNILIANVRPKMPDFMKTGQLIDDLRGQFWSVFFEDSEKYEKYYNMMVGAEGVELDDAVKFVIGVGQLADKDFDMARFCYDKAVKVKSLCEFRAEDLVKKKEEADAAAAENPQKDPDMQAAILFKDEVTSFTYGHEATEAEARAAYGNIYSLYSDYDELAKTAYTSTQEQRDEIYAQLLTIRNEAVAAFESEYDEKIKAYEGRIAEIKKTISDKEDEAKQEGINRVLNSFPTGSTLEEENRLTHEYEDCEKWNTEYQEICKEAVASYKLLEEELYTWWQDFIPRIYAFIYALNEASRNVSHFPLTGWTYSFPDDKRKYPDNYFGNVQSAVYDRMDSEEHLADTEIAYKEYKANQEQLRSYYQDQFNRYNSYAESYAETVADRKQLQEKNRDFVERIPAYVKNQGMGSGSRGYFVYAAQEDNPELYAMVDGGRDHAKMQQIADEMTELYADYQGNAALVEMYKDKEAILKAQLEAEAEISGLQELWDKGGSLRDYGVEGEKVEYEEDVNGDIMTEDESDAFFAMYNVVAVAADFKGYGTEQMVTYQDCFGEIVEDAARIRRRGGTDVLDSFLEDAREINESRFTYMGAYLNPGSAGEVSFEDVFSDPHGCIVTLENIYNGSMAYVPVESISAAGEREVCINSGSTVRLSVDVTPADATIKDIFWESFDDSIASVDSYGNVTAKGPGSVTVRATSADCPIVYSKTKEPGDDQTEPLYWVDFTVEVKGFDTSVTVSDDSVDSICLDTYSGSAERADIPSVINGLPVTDIGSGAFSGNATVKEISLPATVEEIGDEAFKGCTSLEAVGIPAGIKSLGRDVFSGCIALKDIYFGGSAEDWEALMVGSIPEGVTLHYSEGIPTADIRYVAEGEDDAGKEDSGSSSGSGKEGSGSSDSGKEDSGSSSGSGKEGSGSSDSGKEDSGSSGSGKDSSSSTSGAGKEDSGSSSSRSGAVSPTQGAAFASAADNLAPVAADKKINSLVLDFTNVPASGIDPMGLKMTVIKGSKLKTAAPVSTAQSGDPASVKVKRDKKTGCAVITVKSSGSVLFEMEDGSICRVSFTVEAPKADKSKKKLAISSDKEVVYTVKDMFGTSIDGGVLSAVSKAGQAVVKDNVLHVKPAMKDAISVEYRYLNKKYRLKISVK